MNNDIGLNENILSLIRSNSETMILDYLNKLSPEQSSGLRRSNLLHVAIRYNSLNIIKILLDFGIDINKLDTYNRTPLMHAVVNGDTGAMNYLVDRGAKMNIGTSRLSLVKPKKFCLGTANLARHFFSIDSDDSDDSGYSGGITRITRITVLSNVPIFRTFCKFSLACTVKIIDRFIIYKPCDHDHGDYFLFLNQL